MFEFFRQVGEFFSAIFTFIGNIVSGMVYLITMIPKAMVYLTLSFNYIPLPLLVFATTAISICIVFFLIGR